MGGRTVLTAGSRMRSVATEMHRMESMKVIPRSALTRALGLGLWAGLVMTVGGGSGCAGGRLTIFDPLSRSMSRQSASSGEASVQRHDSDAAERQFRSAIRLNPKNGDAHAGLARVLAARGDDARAAESYRSAVKFAPSNPTYAAEFGDCLGRWALRSLDRRSIAPAAMRAYRHARTLAPYDASLALRHGVCAMRLEDYAEALKALRDAVEMTPESVEARIELSAAYDAIGDGVSARREAAEAQRLTSSPTTGVDRAAIAGDVED